MYLWHSWPAPVSKRIFEVFCLGGTRPIEFKLAVWVLLFGTGYGRPATVRRPGRQAL